MENQERIKVLIVDDNEDDRQTYRDLISKTAFHALDVYEAENADDALKMLGESSVDCVLLDSHLSGTDVYELLGDIRKGRPFLPIVMIMDHGDAYIARSALQAGATDFLQKERLIPLDMEHALTNAMERCTMEEFSYTQNEERARLLQELTDANLHLKEFSRTVAHDLRSPLGTIVSLTEMARISPENLPVSEMMDKVEGASRKMMSFISGLLEFSASEENRGEREEVDLNQLIKEAAEFVSEGLKEKTATIDTQENLPSFKGHRLKMLQVFINLMGNAAKYSKPDEALHLKIYCEEIERSSDAQGSDQDSGHKLLRIVVQDNGLGMKPEDCSKIFAPFQRVHEERDIEGSGIGLATVKNIVHSHGGDICAESELGVGTKFSITLPMAGNVKTGPTFVRREVRLECKEDVIVKTRVFHINDAEHPIRILEESRSGKKARLNSKIPLHEKDVLLLNEKEKYEVQWVRDLPEEGMEFGLKILR
jgi:signal transduction histidine kinase